MRNFHGPVMHIFIVPLIPPTIIDYRKIITEQNIIIVFVS